MKHTLQLIIRIYQRTLSPDTGVLRFWYPFGCCRYHPTCSHYLHDAIGVHGVVRGSYFGARRILRCHPWSGGGFDPIPSSSTQ